MQDRLCCQNIYLNATISFSLAQSYYNQLQIGGVLWNLRQFYVYTENWKLNASFDHLIGRFYNDVRSIRQTREVPETGVDTHASFPIQDNGGVKYLNSF